MARLAFRLSRARFLLFQAIALLAWQHANGQPSLVGLWQTSDATGPRSEVRLEVSNGMLYGRIEKVLRETDRAYPRCDWCQGDRRGAPFLGMVIIRDLKPVAGSTLRWDGGHVLDPDTGREFKARIRLNSDGNSLELRGFVTFEAFGRSEIWQRIDDLSGRR
jgi:uncharacterized protein (DUF2147 family)